MAKKTSRMSRKEARSGSKATCTASACPVRPVHTSRYVGFGWRPPMYPDSTESTPSIPSYTASRHQKHPPASAVVSRLDRKSTRLNSSHLVISYAVFCLKKQTGWRSRKAKLAAVASFSSKAVWWHDLARGHLFFFNDTATTEIYTLSLHDALPI